jgi:hypothetical protein
VEALVEALVVVVYNLLAPVLLPSDVEATGGAAFCPFASFPGGLSPTSFNFSGGLLLPEGDLPSRPGNP